jgi:hypothetical protein
MAVKKIKDVLTTSFSKQMTNDNKMSALFIDAVNSIADQEDLTQKIGAARKEYYKSLAYDAKGKETKNHKFLAGWLARVERCLNYKG